MREDRAPFKGCLEQVIPKGRLMIFMSLNVRGLGIPSKNFTLKREVEVNKPSIIMLQESLEMGDHVMLDLKNIFPRRDFVSSMPLDAQGI